MGNVKRKGTTTLIYFSWVALHVVSISCERSKSAPDSLCFAVMGDVHYSIPDYRTADYLIPPVAEELKNLKRKPEFILQTGDLLQGSKGTDFASETAFALKNFEENIHIPFFISKGNHDRSSNYEEIVLPVFSKELRKSISKSYYSFSKSNCHFVILDCTDKDLTEQLTWLDKDLETAKSSHEINHIFVAGHYPLWAVARAGFTRPEYSTGVTSLLAKYKVDAYLCGHTHNKTVTVKIIDGHPLAQIMDAGVVEEGRLFNLAPFLHHVRKEPENICRPGILPLEAGHQIIIPGSELKYFWGYQEGSTTSYYIITVDGKKVQADWHVLGQGVIRSFVWNESGKLEDLVSPPEVKKRKLNDSDFKQIERAWIYAAPWIDKDAVIAPFSINNVQTGTFEISKEKMAYSPFWNKIEVSIDRSILSSIKMENEITISNPAGGKFGMAHMYMLVQFKDGNFARSSVSQRILTSFYPSYGQYTNFPNTLLIDSVEIEKPLARFTLRFNEIF